MAAVTKTSGRYFYENGRVWREARETGLPPTLVGGWNGQIKLPEKPTRDFVRGLCEGNRYLPRVQANRVGCYDVSFTFGKSISIGTFGLTDPKQWKASAEMFSAATRPEVERLVGTQQANAGAQGAKKVPSKGGAVQLVHWQNSFGDVHANVHYAVPNLTATAGKKGADGNEQPGKIGSIANAHEMYELQGVMRARANKRLDDILQAAGYRTVREGHVVGLAGIPAGMVRELSVPRQAMDAAKKRKGFSGPRAEDYYARQARRDIGGGARPTPEQAAARVRRVAKKYGVTPETLKRPDGTPAASQDKTTAMGTAFDVAVRARDECAKRFGTFTAVQFQERLYTLGIGKATTLDALDTIGKLALTNRKYLDIASQKLPDGTVRYSTPKSAEATREAERQYRPDTAEAWADLKKAARGFGEAVLVKTALAGAAALNRLAEAVNPPPRTLTVDAMDLPEFIAAHRPTSRLVAHAKALVAGAFAPGNPHEKAGAAEKVYKSLRTHARLPKNSVLVVERGDYASARELHLLGQIAKRDKAHVMLSERDGRGVPGKQRHHHHAHDLGRD